jgi:hypothetical protein
VANSEILKRVAITNRVTDLEEQLEAKEHVHTAIVTQMQEQIKVWRRWRGASES